MIICIRAGADLRENSGVDTAKFDDKTGLWTITLEDGKTQYKARVSLYNI